MFVVDALAIKTCRVFGRSHGQHVAESFSSSASAPSRRIDFCPNPDFKMRETSVHVARVALRLNVDHLQGAELTRLRCSRQHPTLHDEGISSVPFPVHSVEENYTSTTIQSNLHIRHITAQLTMESIRIPYKQDAFGNPILARVSWAKDGNQHAKPIGRPNIRKSVNSTLTLYQH